MAFVEVEGISTTYGKATVLKKVSFSIERGEITGLLGQNGCGKTTIIKVLAGILKPKEGEIRVDGKKIDRHFFTCCVGYCPQENSFFEKLTVRENIEYFGELYGTKESVMESRIPEILGLLGLDGKMETASGELSGGQKRRLNIACGIIHSPPVLLMDEPSLALDPLSRYNLWDLIKAISSKGTTVILSSNSLDEIYALCNSVVGIKNGSVMFHKTVKEMRMLKSLYPIFE